MSSTPLELAISSKYENSSVFRSVASFFIPISLLRAFNMLHLLNYIFGSSLRCHKVNRRILDYKLMGIFKITFKFAVV